MEINDVFFDKIIINNYNFYKVKIFKRYNKTKLVDLLECMKSHLFNLSTDNFISFINKLNKNYPEIKSYLIKFCLIDKLKYFLIYDKLNLEDKITFLSNVVDAIGIKINDNEITEILNNMLTDNSIVDNVVFDKIINIMKFINLDNFNIDNILSKSNELNNKSLNTLISIIDVDKIISLLRHNYFQKNTNILIEMLTILLVKNKTNSKGIIKEIRKVFLIIIKNTDDAKFIDLIYNIIKYNNKIFSKKFLRLFSIGDKIIEIININSSKNIDLSILLKINKYIKVIDANFNRKLLKIFLQNDYFKTHKSFNIKMIDSKDFLRITELFKNKFDYLVYYLKINTEVEERDILKLKTLLVKKYKCYEILSKNDEIDIKYFLEKKKVNPVLIEYILNFFSNIDTLIIFLGDSIIDADNVLKVVNYKENTKQIKIKNRNINISSTFITPTNIDKVNLKVKNMQKKLDENDRLFSEIQEELNNYYAKHNIINKMTAKSFLAKQMMSSDIISNIYTNSYIPIK